VVAPKYPIAGSLGGCWDCAASGRAKPVAARVAYGVSQDRER
jgi:hypothetical protein